MIITHHMKLVYRKIMDLPVLFLILCYLPCLFSRHAHRGKSKPRAWDEETSSEAIPWSPGEVTDEPVAPPTCVCIPLMECGASWRQGDLENAPSFECPNAGDVCCEDSVEETGAPKETTIYTPTPEPETEDVTKTFEVCGISNPVEEPSNVGAQETAALLGEFPWTLLISNNNGFERYRCGASLIQPNIAVTAAHCVFNSTQDPGALLVRAGEWDLTRETESLPYQERRVSSIIIHPQFDGRNPISNIALLYFDDPFELTDNVNTICLPGQNNQDQLDMQRCMATGWGIDTAGRHQDVMKKIELPEVSNSYCEMQLRKTRLGRFFKLHPSMMCAGGNRGIDTCVGDGGGPLACFDSYANTYHLIGITSWGMGCGREGIPGIYTDVRQFTDWIESQLQEIRLDKSAFTWKKS